MLTVMGFATIAVVLALLLSNRVGAVVALIGVPVTAAFLMGFGPGEVAAFVGAGIGGVAATTAMFVFAILFFGVMRDAGLFDPIVRRVLRFAGNNPVTIAVATVVLAMAAHLDGAGATTFLITVPAMLPLYDALGMRRLILAALTGLGAGVMNIVPWGGPTARAATATGIPANDLWAPLIPAQIIGMVTCVAIAYYLGVRERNRIGATPDREPTPSRVGGGDHAPGGSDVEGSDAPREHDSDQGSVRPPAYESENPHLLRPRLYWFNALLTLATVGMLISGVLPPELVFMLALVIALVLNYPGMKEQTDRIDAHAKGAILMASTLLSAGVFLGVMEESGMIQAMAESMTGVMPSFLGPGLPLLIGVLAVPMSLIFGPDAYYFAVMPVLAAVGEGFGVEPLHVAQASITGQETVGFPISPMTGSFYLLVGLCGVSIGSHIRFLLPWAWLVGLVVFGAGAAMGVIPLWVS
ncbi:CitMHS family transporter [Nocardiopsis sp. MG754419]|uniref:CitMHS family transporter n=1 Tax=Nocardiopsis sp. MG754419 TaxID=2259865 RepID=UPI001BADD8AC|nr:citrate:proton symporter [Nocardiopsis sp. MG754419]MBR8743251.1 citrate transporter [Nocardiopsis sp. MG754419]